MTAVSAMKRGVSSAVGLRAGAATTAAVHVPPNPLRVVTAPFVQRRRAVGVLPPDAYHNSYTHHRTRKRHSQPPRVKRIILVRHGESLGNVDERAYVTTADWRIPLTDIGRQQAREAGQRLESILDPQERVFVYFSPYCRTTSTKDLMLQQLSPGRVIGMRQEPRIAEQQFGNFQDYAEVLRAKTDRAKFGRFFYRFPNGESGLDVYNRVSSFIATMKRDTQQLRDSAVDVSQTNMVVVTHGLALRLFLMRWFQITVEEFEEMRNPSNADICVMERKECPLGRQYFELSEDAASKLCIRTKMLHDERGWRLDLEGDGMQTPLPPLPHAAIENEQLV